MRPATAPSCFPFFGAFASCAALCALSLLAGVGCNAGSGTPPPPAPSHFVTQDATPTAGGNAGARFTLLTPSQAELDFGTLPQGGKGALTFTLKNTSASVVEVARIESSCPCLAVELEKNILGPGEEAAATARVDLASEPNFRGAVRLEATGLTGTAGVKAFRISCNLQVSSAASVPGG